MNPALDAVADVFGVRVQIDARGLLQGAERGDGRDLCQCVRVECQPDAVQQIRDDRIRQGITDTQAGKPVGFRKRAHDQQVVEGADQRRAFLVIIGSHILGIGFIQHNQHIFRNTLQEIEQLVARHIGSGRIVRIGNEHDTRAVIDYGQHCAEIVPVWRCRIGCWFGGHHANFRTCRLADDGINRKAVLRHDH